MIMFMLNNVFDILGLVVLSGFSNCCCFLTNQKTMKKERRMNHDRC